MSHLPQPPHAGDLRKGRYSESGRIYRITTVTHDRKELFTDFHLGRLVVAALRAAPARTLCFVVMPDHLHWLVELDDRADLPKLVQGVKSVSAHRINAARGQTGKVWQAGYYDEALRREQDLKHMARYIVANPLRAGLVEHIGDYPLWDAIWL